MLDAFEEIAYFSPGSNTCQKFEGIFLGKRPQQLEQLFQIGMPTLGLGRLGLGIAATAVARGAFTALGTLPVALYPVRRV